MRADFAHELERCLQPRLRLRKAAQDRQGGTKLLVLQKKLDGALLQLGGAGFAARNIQRFDVQPQQALRGATQGHAQLVNSQTLAQSLDIGAGPEALLFLNPGVQVPNTIDEFSDAARAGPAPHARTHNYSRSRAPRLTSRLVSERL